MGDGPAGDLLVATSRDDGVERRPDARLLPDGKSALVRGPHLTVVVTNVEPGLYRSHNPPVVAATPLSAAAPPGAAQARDARRLATGADELGNWTEL